ncbi:hypothetical protein BX666DRAFT_1863931 [Dichotomocladium elegans]|nr:hypothetical protein BX666DRAFT_1863931 [Dichotomocladium elegans]
MEKYVDRILRYEIITGEPVAFEALSKYGGLWFDIHTLFVRDLSPLLESGNDWMSQATCFTSVDGNPFLGSSMMYFRKHSPHLCELKHAAGAMRELYYRVYQRILRNGYEPWAVMPWCYVDPSQCRKPNRLQSPFDPSASFDRRMLESVFAYHYHTLPSSSSRPTGAIYNYLDGKYAKALNR